MKTLDGFDRTKPLNLRSVSAERRTLEPGWAVTFAGVQGKIGDSPRLFFFAWHTVASIEGSEVTS